MTRLTIENTKIALFDGVSDSGIQVFKDAGFKNIELYPHSLPEAELKEVLKTAHVVGIRSKTKLTADFLQDAPNLICIGRYGIGVNNIDLNVAREKGIAVFNGPFASTRSVAELVIGNIFSLFRKISEKSYLMQNGGWPKSASGCFEVRGKTLGLIGYGNISSQVSVMAEAIGMNVIYSDVRKVLPMGRAKQVTLEEVLKTSDVISLHVPGHPTTKNMIHKETLSQMKKGACIINTARGDVVNPDDLKAAIESGHIRGAALDVFVEEPKSAKEEFISIFRGMEQVIMTPHIGGATQESQFVLGAEVSEKMKNIVLFGDTSTALNFPQIMVGKIKNTRLVIIHRNEAGVLLEINKIIAKAGLNILAENLKTLQDKGVVTLDLESKPEDEIIEKINSLTLVQTCRILQ